MILTCDALTVSYEDVVLENVSFSVEAGDFVTIIGENGGGKTTLCRAILGLLPLKKGKVYMQGGLCIGYVPQKNPVNSAFPASVEEIVRSGLPNMFILSKSNKEKVRHILSVLGIDDLRKKCFRALSGGQQKRVLIARAMAACDGFLLLDEPCAGLDPHAQTELYAMLSDLNKKEGVTILMVSHDIQSAATVSNKFLHIHKSVQYFGPPHDFICSECGKRFLGGNQNE